MYTVKLKGGTELSDLTINGNNFISKTRIDPAVFEGDSLSHVEIIGDGPYTLPESADGLELVQCVDWGEGSAFILREVPEEEKDKRLLRASATDITDIQLALAELYEMMGGGL